MGIVGRTFDAVIIIFHIIYMQRFRLPHVLRAHRYSLYILWVSTRLMAIVVIIIIVNNSPWNFFFFLTQIASSSRDQVFFAKRMRE